MSIAAGIMQIFQGAVKFRGRVYLGHKVALTAATTQTQAAATQITRNISRFDTVANSGDGAKLPPCDPSRGPVVVHNNGAQPMTLYSQETSGVNIILSSGSVAGSTGITVAAHKTYLFFGTESNWLGGSLGT